MHEQRDGPAPAPHSEAPVPASPTPPPPPAPSMSVRAAQSWSAIALFVGVTLAVLAADLALKYVAFRTVAGVPVQLDPQQPGSSVIPPHPPVKVIPYVLSLRLTANEGAVFGLGQGGRWVFIVVSIVAVAVILRVFWRSRADAWVFHVGLALILGGALGNLYDRARYAAVRDMFWLFPELRLWPWIFNLADAALMIGVGLVVVVMWQNERRPQTGEAASR